MHRLSFIALSFLVFVGIAQAQNPHGDELKIDCKACHNPGGWTVDYNNMDFSHDTLGFALEGRHQEIACKDCHTNMVFEEMDNDCISCHTDVHSMSVGNDCARCHTSDNWLVNNVPELHEQNGFPLFGQHRIADCTQCHISESELEWNRIGQDCASCHIDDYMASIEPNHQMAGFSTECIECHLATADNWSAGNFHLFFPLEFGHDIQDCNECHNGSDFAAASPECSSCHLDDFQATTNPDHQAAGFSTDCLECHGPVADNWGAQNFHQFFPLEAGHNIQDCNQCHDGNNYSAASPECISCHQSDYDNVNSPNHVTAGFGTDCIQCHTTNNWGSALFDQHDAQYFPIFSGRHRNEWSTCDECHTTAGDFSMFSCIDCHEHNNPSRLANEHDEVSGYVYESNACYSCHPDGSE